MKGIRNEGALNMETSIDPVLSGEAAQILDVSVDTVRLWERQGRLRALKTTHGVRLFDRQEVERLARERQSQRSGR
jgi:excisionase family DNA binding protein